MLTGTSIDVVLAIGTRPEAVKQAALSEELRASPLHSEVWSSAQHRALLDQTLDAIGLHADVDLDVMTHDQPLDRILTLTIERFGEALDRRRPGVLVVQGDTTTALACSLAAFHRRIPVAHVEAGLRSGHADPFPEETNRTLIDRLASLHFAPTEANRANLIAEGIDPGAVHVTGNPGLDTLRRTLEALDAGPIVSNAPAAEGAIVVTTHRRESHGTPMRRMCAGLRSLASRTDRPIVVTRHRNPAVAAVLDAELGAVDGIELLDPIAYPQFVALLRGASLVLTDSGGVQEEAPFLGVPVLVLRDHTERPEGLAEGRARLVGTEPDAIVASALELLDRPGSSGSIDCPYGDGHSAPRIVGHLADLLGAVDGAATAVEAVTTR